MTCVEGLGQIGNMVFWECDGEAQTRSMTLDLYMMDFFHQQAVG